MTSEASVLILEEDEEVLGKLKKIIERAGFSVFEATSMDEVEKIQRAQRVPLFAYLFGDSASSDKKTRALDLIRRISLGETRSHLVTITIDPKYQEDQRKAGTRYLCDKYEAWSLLKQLREDSE